MRINMYNLELDEKKHPVLVKEKGFNYAANRVCRPHEVVNMCNELLHLDARAEEYVYAIAVTSKQEVLGIFEISHGTINASLLQPREILIRMLMSGATGMIILHNHPSGDSSPSKEDMVVFQRIKDAAGLVGLAFNDFIVVGSANYYYSFRENGFYKDKKIGG